MFVRIRLPHHDYQILLSDSNGYSAVIVIIWLPYDVQNTIATSWLPDRVIIFWLLQCGDCHNMITRWCSSSQDCNVMLTIAWLEWYHMYVVQVCVIHATTTRCEHSDLKTQQCQKKEMRFRSRFEKWCPTDACDNSRLSTHMCAASSARLHSF